MDTRREPTEYEIRVRGTLSQRMLTAFPELSARNEARETVLIGRLPDQAALHGIIGRIEALGLELLEVLRPHPLAVGPDGEDVKVVDGPTADRSDGAVSPDAASSEAALEAE